ncbi:MAG: hypothetical protein KGH75_06245 [Rhodospirillales bacterium]|nr:hypothetical protein [Rhodospirillales bacterium]
MDNGYARAQAAYDRQEPPCVIDDDTPPAVTADDLIMWFGNDRERQAQLLRYMIRECDFTDLSADDVLQIITGEPHANLMVLA